MIWSFHGEDLLALAALLALQCLEFLLNPVLLLERDGLPGFAAECFYHMNTRRMVRNVEDDLGDWSRQRLTI
jgi:hypothetical protein